MDLDKKSQGVLKYNFLSTMCNVQCKKSAYLKSIGGRGCRIKLPGICW